MEGIGQLGFEPGLGFGLDRFVEDGGFAGHAVQLEGDDPVAVLVGGPDVNQLDEECFSFFDADGDFLARLETVEESGGGQGGDFC